MSCKNPRPNYLLFLDKHQGRVVILSPSESSFLSIREEIDSKFMFNPFLSTPEHTTVTVVLQCKLHTYLFLKCWKISKRTILHNLLHHNDWEQKFKKSMYTFEMGLYYGSR